jgi:hypothetical protein
MAFPPSLARSLVLTLFEAPAQAYEDYIVRFTNHTSVTFDEVIIFYKRLNLPGVVFLQEIGLVPGEVRDFNLGLCIMMESYVIGIFIGEDLVGQLPGPGQGNMTPARASEFDPSDVDPCADSWGVFEN